MMSAFLRNLIDRHQEHGVGGEICRKVQPRPKTRFESDFRASPLMQNDSGNSVDSNSITRTDSEMEVSLPRYSPVAKPPAVRGRQAADEAKTPARQDINTLQTQPDSSRVDELNGGAELVTAPRGHPTSRSEVADQTSDKGRFQQTTVIRSAGAEVSEPPKSRRFLLPIELNSDKGGIKPDSTLDFDALNERVEGLRLLFGQNKPRLETAINPIEIRNVPSVEAQPELSEISEHSTKQESCQTDAVKRSMIPRRGNANNPAPPPTNEQNNSRLRNGHLAAPETVKAIRAEPEHFPLATETAFDDSHSLLKDDERSNRNILEQHVPQQTGSLQAPAWLTEMQAELNKQIQAMQKKAESVINVTIGRVEVRAVQAEREKTARPKKPSGVMSLDDYLKQRERGKA